MSEIFWKDSLDQVINRLVELVNHEDLNKVDYMLDAVIQRFEFVIELYWKVLKKILSYEKVESTSPREVVRKAFQFHLIDDEKIWLAMLDDRNQTSHVYREEDARKVLDHIKEYAPVLQVSYEKLHARYFG